MFKSLSVLSDCLRPNGLQLASILKITADGDCSCKIKTAAVKLRRLLHGKVMTNLNSLLKSRHYFANKERSI